MIKNAWKTLSLLAFCGAIVLANPADAKADEVSGPGLSSGNYIATVEAETVNISTDESGQEVLMAASKGSSFQVVEDMGDGFVKVKVKDTYGYLPVDGNATVTQTDEATIAALEAAYDAPAEFRQSVVNYALQFVGGRYAYGGSDPHEAGRFNFLWKRKVDQSRSHVHRQRTDRTLLHLQNGNQGFSVELPDSRQDRQCHWRIMDKRITGFSIRDIRLPALAAGSLLHPMDSGIVR